MVSKRTLGLVLSGGGARGAYEAGIIHYIRTMLPPKIRSRNFDVQCGASVGAINTSFMVATSHDLSLQGKELHRLWQNLREGDIYCRDSRALWEFIGRSTRGVLLNILRGPKKMGPHFNGFLDTTPFLPFIEKAVPWKMISKNIRSGLVKAMSLVATNVFTGRMELFIEKHPSVEYTGEHLHHFTPIKPIHAKASAAIPIVFPSVMIDGIAYTDGGLRLNTPMSPAIQLGADSLLVIGLHHRAGPEEKIPFHGKVGEPPALGQVLGRVMNTIFLDRIQYDIEQLERINRIVDWAEMVYGENFLKELNQMLVSKKIRGDIANRGLKRLNVLRIRPSEDIGEMFGRCFKKGRDRHFTSFEKLLVRFLDVDPTNGIDFLSYIVFMPEYLKALLDLGFEDARRHHNQLKEFLG
ncbi:MAG: patatin-like phospholipase family protein [Deltaproteobacteria bacterium]|nr:patatin-like phospholipase family protein [Deltaproteobacteria bacterium]